MARPGTETDLDAADRRILRELQRDGRITVVDLSSRVGLSATPCWRRIREMENRNVIEGYSCLVNPAAVGFGIEALVQVTIEKHNAIAIAEFIAQIAKAPNIINGYTLAGSFDVLLHVAAESIADLEQFLMVNLAKIPGVSHLQSSLVLKKLTKTSIIPV